MNQLEISPDELILAYGELGIQCRILEQTIKQKDEKIAQLEKQLEFYDDKLWNESAPKNNLA